MSHPFGYKSYLIEYKVFGSLQQRMSFEIWTQKHWVNWTGQNAACKEGQEPTESGDGRRRSQPVSCGSSIPWCSCRADLVCRNQCWYSTFRNWCYVIISTDMDCLAEVYNELREKSSKVKKIWLCSLFGKGSMQGASIERKLPRLFTCSSWIIGYPRQSPAPSLSMSKK